MVFQKQRNGNEDLDCVSLFPPLQHLPSDSWETGLPEGVGGEFGGKDARGGWARWGDLEELFPSQRRAEGTQDGSLLWRRESAALQIGRKIHRMRIWSKSLHSLTEGACPQSKSRKESRPVVLNLPQVTDSLRLS